MCYNVYSKKKAVLKNTAQPIPQRPSRGNIPAIVTNSISGPGPIQELQPDEHDNEIIIELDRDNQYSRTQPRANEPQGEIALISIHHERESNSIILCTYCLDFARCK